MLFNTSLTMEWFVKTYIKYQNKLKQPNKYIKSPVAILLDIYICSMQQLCRVDHAPHVLYIKHIFLID